jgi:polysaccharide deacetylase family protein (PEP-CTERM system associated)
MNNILTFDIEDWFQVFYGESCVNKKNWDRYPTEINAMVERILLILELNNVKATFFCVGWLANKYPELLKKIHKNGHEIASHSYWHTEIFNLTPKQFKNDTKISKMSLQDAIGVEIIGYRAPGFSIHKEMNWALEILKELDFKYDSSLLFKNTSIEKLPNGLIEVAPNSINIGEKFLPVNGGFVFRAMPFFLYDKYIKHLNSKEIPLNFYAHSWEVRESDYKLPIKGIRKFIQYFNTSSVENKLNMLLKSYKFTTVNEFILSKGFLV